MHFLRRRRPRRTLEAPDPRMARALLDFGASGARAALVRLLPEGAEVVGHAGVTGRGAMARPGQVMQRELLATLAERALSSAEWDSAREGELPLIADDALVGLTGPLLNAHRSIWNLSRRNPVAPIYEAELLEILEASQRRSLEIMSQGAAEIKIRRTLVGSQLVGVMSVRGDTGEALRLPDVTRGIPGPAGDYLAVALCNLTWPTKGLEMLERVLEDLELNLEATPPIAQAVAAALPRPDAILIDIGQEHTEIALAEGGTLSDLHSLPIGGHFFTQTLTRNLRLSEKHAELVKCRRGDKGRTLPPTSPVFRLLREATERWWAGVEPILQRMAGAAPLPPRLYLYGGGAQLPELMEQLRHYPWMARLPFERPPEVERLLPQQLRRLSDPRGLLRSPAQVGLAALAVWAWSDPPPLQQYLNRVARELATHFILV